MSAQAMPPVRLLSQAFIASMLSSSENKLKLQRRESEETVETMIISDDENELTPIHEKIIRRKALEKEEKAMKEEGTKKKETVTNIENRMKSLKLETLKDFGLQ